MSDKPRQKTYARSIPHPLFERLIVDDAMNKESNEWKPERYHEYLSLIHISEPTRPY